MRNTLIILLDRVRNLFLTRMVFCFILLLGNADLTNADSDQNDVLSHKIRAGFLNQWNTDLPPKMGQCGMTHALVYFGYLQSPIQKYNMNEINKWADLCQKAGIKLFPVICTWGNGEKEWIQPRYNYYDGVEHKETPCPLEMDVYKLVVHKRVLELAKLSHSIPIAGVVIDLEMYGADVIVYPKYCLCDYCFEKFLSASGVKETIPKSKRQDYLVKSNKVEAYQKFMEDYIEQLSKQTKEQLEAIAPDFMIGGMLLDLDKPYIKGLAKGLGSGKKPVLAFSEKTYIKGFNPYICEIQKRFHDSGTNAKLVAGIWQNKFPPENLAEQYYHCAKDSAGYWIYTMESLSSVIPSWYSAKRLKDRTLPFPKDNYWQAITLANKELVKLSSDPNYISFLKTPTRHK